MKPRFHINGLPASGRGYEHVCPHCRDSLQLYELRDGDQAYWCHRCERGHRAGDLPAEALQPAQAAV